jgi:hypothetical protein
MIGGTIRTMDRTLRNCVAFSLLLLIATACGSGSSGGSSSPTLLSVNLVHNFNPPDSSGILHQDGDGSDCSYNEVFGSGTLPFMRTGNTVVVKDASGVQVGSVALTDGVTSDVQKLGAGRTSFTCTWTVAWRVPASSTYTITVDGHPVGKVTQTGGKTTLNV